ncbi:MAG TPA: VWA domain-containing protein [Candidatus Acidoferrales bacterium]|jgi:VWFA-related protein|nr:VWA domain-containing protein [Candidatus Acidoferrales bacterium]
MGRKIKISATAAALLATVLAPFAAKAQNSPISSSENLPAKPEPVSKPYTFPQLGPDKYSRRNRTPPVTTTEPIETVPTPIATELDPYNPSGNESGQETSPLGQKRIRVFSEEVLVPVTVLNSRGELVLDLEQKDFHVFDNGVEQKIDHWDLGGDSLAVALVIETSAHIQMMAPVIRGMGSIFTETVMALNGEAAVITYDTTVDVRQPFTTDHGAIQRAIAKVDFEVPAMRLYDAMGKAVELLASQPPNFRRVMLIVGESQDMTSALKLNFVLRDAQLANISIYAVGPSSTTADLRFGRGPFGGDNLPAIVLPKPLPSISTTAPGTDPEGRPIFDLGTPAIWLITRGINEIKNHQLELAVAATGGVHYRAIRDSTIRSALDQIGGELHAQYVLAYTPASGRTAGFHSISVTVARPNLKIRSRPGYFVPSLPDARVSGTAADVPPPSPLQP